MRARPLPIPAPIAVPLAALAALAVAMLFASAAAAATSAVYTNPGRIAIANFGSATPYPSPITVQGHPGRITDVNVTLRKFDHTRPTDVDILLVSPTGRTSVVMSDACGLDPIPNASWIFDQEAAAPIDECDQFFYRPADHAGLDGADTWPGAPPGPHVADFDRFIGDDPNGSWRLYVRDGNSPHSGKIDLGWAIEIQTEAPHALVPGPGEGGRASPYPVTRTVGVANEVISDIDVSLGGIHHERPGDLDLMLLGPRGQQVMLMSDACGSTRAKAARWVWDDEAAGPMASAGGCASGVSYRPTDHEPGDPVPAPAPAGAYGASLSVFDHTDPNGEWRLYAYDDQPGGADGFFVERFALDIETTPKAKVSSTEAAVELVEGQTGVLTLVRDSVRQDLGEATVRVVSTPLSASSGSDFEPIATTLEFGRGERQATVPIRALADSLAEGPETFAIEIGQTSGDAEPADPSGAVVTIRDPDPGPGPGGGGPDPVTDPLPGDGDGGPGPGPDVDRDAPAIGRVTLRPARFAVGRRRTARTARTARGTRIRYTLSEPAAVTLRFERAAAGRRVGRACRPVTERNRDRRPCRRHVAAGALRRAGRAGANRVAFSGRVGRRALRRGLHRLVVTATDAAGNRSSSRPRRFRIVR